MFDGIPEAQSETETVTLDPCPLAFQEWRQGMIKEAAYYRFLHRGCGVGKALDDWLAAEHDVDAFLLLPIG
ncbi:MAG TPA: DUF2934 domain-containing protein [Steroidobacteraceae bacterium]